MRPIKVATAVVAALVISAVIFSGYTAYRNSVAASFAAPSGLFANTRTVQDVINKIVGAPAMICDMRLNDFKTSVRARAYVDRGMMRLDSVSTTDQGTVEHSFIDRNGLVFWNEGDQLSRLSKPDTLFTFPSYNSISCTPWWFPDPSIFSYPPISSDN